MTDAKTKAKSEGERRQRIGSLIDKLALTLPRHMVCKQSRQTDILEAAAQFIKECRRETRWELGDPKTGEQNEKLRYLEENIKLLEERCNYYAKFLDACEKCKNKILSGKSKNGEMLIEESREVQDKMTTNGECAPTTHQVILIVDPKMVGGADNRAKCPAAFRSALNLPKLLPKSAESNSSNELTCEIEPSSSVSQTNKPKENGNTLSSTTIAIIPNHFQVPIPAGDQNLPPEMKNAETETVLAETRDVSVQTESNLVCISRAISPIEMPAIKNTGRKRLYLRDSHHLSKDTPPMLFASPVSDNARRKHAKIAANHSELLNPKTSVPNFQSFGLGKGPQSSKPNASNRCASVLRVEDILQPNGSHIESNHPHKIMRSSNRDTFPVVNSSNNNTIGNVIASNSSMNGQMPIFGYAPRAYNNYSNNSSTLPSLQSNNTIRPTAKDQQQRFTTRLQPTQNIRNAPSATASFSIESLQSGVKEKISPRTARNSATGANSKATAKLSHFPPTMAPASHLQTSATGSGPVNSLVSSYSEIPLPYSDVPFFVPCFSQPPIYEQQIFDGGPGPPSVASSKSYTSTSRINYGTSSQLQNSELSSIFVPNDGSSEVNLSNSIFDTQSSNRHGPRPVYGPLDNGRKFYPSLPECAAPERLSAQQSFMNVSTSNSQLGWQWSDYQFGNNANNFQTMDNSTQSSSAPKTQNFQIATMFPETTGPQPRHQHTQQQQHTFCNNDRWTTYNSQNSASLYENHQSSDGSGGRSRACGTFDGRSSNNFMPSFHFSNQTSNDS